MEDLEYRPSYSSSDAEMDAFWKPMPEVLSGHIPSQHARPAKKDHQRQDDLGFRDLVLLMARKEMGNAYVNWASEDYSAFKRLCIKLGAEWGWPA